MVKWLISGVVGVVVALLALLVFTWTKKGSDWLSRLDVLADRVVKLAVGVAILLGVVAMAVMKFLL